SRVGTAGPPLTFLVLAARRLPPRAVALIRQAPLARFLALGWVGYRVVMVRVIGPAPACLDGFLRWLGWDQTIAAVANKVGSPRLDECLAHREVVLRLEEL